MPLFEGITYTGDKNVIVIDFGAAYTKCGIAGEKCPRCILPSELKDEKTGVVRKLWQYQNEKELYENLKDYLFMLYFRHLLTNPKDRRMVICESLLCPEVFRSTLANVLFKHFEVSSVMFGSGHLTSLLTLGINTGLVMDVGFTETLVVPVYDGIPILKAIQSLPLAGKAIQERIREMLLSEGTVWVGDNEKPLSSCPEYLTDDILQDIKVRCCFVTNQERAQKIHEVEIFQKDGSVLPKPVPGVQYPLDGGSLLHISGRVREHVCEVMFEQDNEQTSITTLLLDAIVQCPIDMRVEMSQNIVITGGTSMLPGFLHRVQTELAYLKCQPRFINQLALKNFRFHQPPAKANYTAWLGGSLFGALEMLPSRSIDRDTFLKTGKLTDWCSYSEETS